ncbi:uncharacterized protein LOC111185348 isoform X3 [Delphinapterus leucas]|uniref:Uncharacterized protein LOC111185348 isoform X3 n=1 Tax=Delphinapterus leucas TaxID=9749 RepID=A0A7F8KD97_DELLE|nr:uncharacterized protein LOC111185348 isoform X3 [Delphinapterus leucas]
MKRGTKERGNVAFCAWCLKGIAEMEEFLKNLAKERMTCKNLPNPESMKQTFNNTSQVDGRWKRAVEEEAFRDHLRTIKAGVRRSLYGLLWFSRLSNCDLLWNEESLQRTVCKVECRKEKNTRASLSGSPSSLFQAGQDILGD